MWYFCVNFATNYVKITPDSNYGRYVNNKGWTPLIYAVSEDRVELLKLLIAHEVSHPTSEKFPIKAYSIHSIDADMAPVFKVSVARWL